MIRILTPAAFILVAMSAAAQDLDRLRTQPTLKSTVTVSSGIVRIGDLIDDVGEAAEVAIFRAPDLGHTGYVPAARIIEAARAHQVIGVDTRNLTEVAVTRASRPITPKAVEEHILRFFAGQHGLGRGEDLVVAYDREYQTVHVEPDADDVLQIVRSRYDARSGRFDVIVQVAGRDSAQRVPLRYTGRIFEAVEVAVATRALSRGDVLGPSDVTLVRKPKSEVARDALTPTETTVGLAARQPLRAGQVLRRADLTKAEIVRRNETVTLIYEVPGIVLTMRAKALEVGGQGDVIAVLNLQSNRTIQGTVKGPGLVSVSRNLPITAAPAPAALAAAATPRAE